MTPLRRLLLPVLAFVLMAWPVVGQLPPSQALVVQSATRAGTPIQGGTASDCLTIGSDNKLSQAACGGGGSSVSSFSAGTTGFTPNSATTGAITLSGTLIGANGGTGVANTGKTITLGGNFTTSGAFATTLTATNTTSITLPTTGTLATLAGAETLSSKTLTAPIITSTTWGSIGAATTNGQTVRVSNVGDNTIWVANGTRWKPQNGCALLSTLDTTSSSINNTDTVVFSYSLPAAFLQLKDRLRLFVSGNKSGTTDTYLLTTRLGTAGTTSDTSIGDFTSFVTSTNRAAGMFNEWRIESATTVQRLANSGGTAANSGYSNAGNTAGAAAVTISNVSNPLFFDVSIASSSTNDTVTLVDAQLFYCASVN